MAQGKKSDVLLITRKTTTKQHQRHHADLWFSYDVALNLRVQKRITLKYVWSLSNFSMGVWEYVIGCSCSGTGTAAAAAALAPSTGQRKELQAERTADTLSFCISLTSKFV